MTRYYYEALNDDSFQKLAQALLAITHPDIQCFPLGQADGGRDALVPVSDYRDGGFVVFQVKYTNDPNAKDARTLLEKVIASEKPKVDRLVARGAQEYYLTRRSRNQSRLANKVFVILSKISRVRD